MDTKFICKKSIKFFYVEEKLYQKYPQCRRPNNCFVVNGGPVKRDSSLEENKIKNNDKIMLLRQNK